MDLIPRKGAYIHKITNEDVREIYQIREMVEGFAGHLATENMTDEDIAEVEVVRQDNHAVLPRPGHELRVGRSRCADARPMPRFMPHRCDGKHAQRRDIHVDEDSHVTDSGNSRSSVRHAA